MSNQQKDDRPTASPATGKTGGPGLQQQARDTTGGQGGDALGHAAGAAAGADPNSGKVKPPAGKDGTQAA
jgi:hypothetical protein